MEVDGTTCVFGKLCRMVIQGAIHVLDSIIFRQCCVPMFIYLCTMGVSHYLQQSVNNNHYFEREALQTIIIHCCRELDYSKWDIPNVQLVCGFGF